MAQQKKKEEKEKRFFPKKKAVKRKRQYTPPSKMPMSLVEANLLVEKMQSDVITCRVGISKTNGEDRYCVHVTGLYTQPFTISRKGAYVV